MNNNYSSNRLISLLKMFKCMCGVHRFEKQVWLIGDKRVKKLVCSRCGMIKGV